MRAPRLHSWRVIMGLTIGVAALVASFNTVPFAVLSGRFGVFQPPGALEDAVARGLDELWRSGRPQLPAVLIELQAYSRAWHTIKIVICLLMVAALVVLAMGLWRRYLWGATSRSAGYAVAATVPTVLAPLAIMLLVANIQAAAVPLVALLPLLPEPGSAPVAQTSVDIIAALSTSPGTSAHAPALTLLVARVELYHWVLAASCAPIVIAMSLLSVVWLRLARTCRGRSRSMARALTIVTVLATLALLGVAVIAVLAALDPIQAVIDIVGGTSP